MEYFSDNDNDVSFPGCNSRGATNDIEITNLLDLERDHERIIYVQKLIEMNNQIRELTSIVRVLADQITSTETNAERNTPVKREENTHDAVKRDILCNSDTPSEKFYKFIKVATEDLRNQNSDRPAYEQNFCIRNSPKSKVYGDSRFWRFGNTKLLNSLHV